MAINWWAAIVAAVASFGLGGLWYSPALFGNAWMRESGVTEQQVKDASPALTFGLSFVLSLMASVVFAMFLGPDPALPFALGAGASAGFCWVAASFGINYAFEHRSAKLWAINGGYHTVQFTIFGLILGAWH